MTINNEIIYIYIYINNIEFYIILSKAMHGEGKLQFTF